LPGQDGADNIDGQSENDYIYGDFTGVAEYVNRDLTPNESGDTLTGDTGSDEIYGDTPGIDGTFGYGGGADSIDGGSGNDLMYGGPGNDTMSGGAGMDTFMGESGSDTIFAQDNEFDNGDAGAGDNDILHKDNNDSIAP
jgi:Ca2+-binding RTX toxin-like protein